MTLLEKVHEALNTFNPNELSSHFPASDPQIGGEYGDGEYGDREHRPTEEFWALWQEKKDALKAIGVRVWKDEGYGDWWVSIPKAETVIETETPEIETSEPTEVASAETAFSKAIKHGVSGGTTGYYSADRNLFSDAEIEAIEASDDFKMIKQVTKLSIKRVS